MQNKKMVIIPTTALAYSLIKGMQEDAERNAPRFDYYKQNN